MDWNWWGWWALYPNWFKAILCQKIEMYKQIGEEALSDIEQYIRAESARNAPQAGALNQKR